MTVTALTIKLTFCTRVYCYMTVLVVCIMLNLIYRLYWCWSIPGAQQYRSYQLGHQATSRRYHGLYWPVRTYFITIAYPSLYLVYTHRSQPGRIDNLRATLSRKSSLKIYDHTHCQCQSFTLNLQPTSFCNLVFIHTCKFLNPSFYSTHVHSSPHVHFSPHVHSSPYVYSSTRGPDDILLNRTG